MEDMTSTAEGSAQIHPMGLGFEKTLNDQLANLRIRQLLIEMASDDPIALTTWYDTNQDRYQSPVELLVNLIVVTPTREVQDLVDTLRAIAAEYTGGGLEEHAESIQGAGISSAWIGIATLDAYQHGLEQGKQKAHFKDWLNSWFTRWWPRQPVISLLEAQALIHSASRWRCQKVRR